MHSKPPNDTQIKNMQCFGKRKSIFFLKNENRSILDLTHHPLTVVGSVPGDFIDWATAVVSEGDTCQLFVSFTYYSSGPIYKTLD